MPSGVGQHPARKCACKSPAHIAKAITGSDGRWQARVQPPAPGGPYTIIIDGPQHRELHEVLVGDVWLCGGQSNMELPLSRTRNGDEVIKSAHNPEIRFYKVAGHASVSPSAVPQGQWKICSPETATDAGGFSAVAYFFARRLQEHIHTFIGIVLVAGIFTREIPEQIFQPGIQTQKTCRVLQTGS